MNQLEKAAIEYFKTDGQKLWTRYYSPDLLAAVVKKIQEDRLLPTIVSAGIAFRRLIELGIVERTDGKDEAYDRAEDVAIAKRGVEAAIISGSLAPLTRDEIEYFASLSPFEVAKLYWGPDNDGLTGFAVRYNKACAEMGFRQPEHYAGGLR